MALKIGDKIPELLGVDADGNEVKASQFKGKKLVVYFYPKDNTSGCTAEACSLSNGYDELLNAGFAVVGVSKDGVASHRKFSDKYSLPFKLIADTDLTLNEVFGVWQEKKMCVKVYMGTIRTTFVTDENGVITNYDELMQQALNTYNNSAKTEADEEAYNNFKDAISQYEETYSLWQDEKSNLTDMVNEELSKKLAVVQYKLELKLDIADSDIEYVEYLLERIENRAFSAAKAITELGKNTESLLEKGKAYEESIKGALEAEGVSEENISKILNGEMGAQDMVNLGLSSETIDLIKNAQQGLLENNKELLANQEEVWSKINKVVEETVEAFDKQAEAISHAGSVLNHYRNIVDLVGQENLDISNAMMDAAADANINNAMASLTNSKNELEKETYYKITVKNFLSKQIIQTCIYI